MMWTAPELLRTANRPPQGTKKGDVYSFAIILQEIVFRARPFFLNHADPKGGNLHYVITRERFSEKPIVAFTNSAVFITDFYI